MQDHRCIETASAQIIGWAPSVPDGFTVDFSRNPRYMLGRVPLLGVTDVLRDLGFINPEYFTQESRDRGSAVHMACHMIDTPERGPFDWTSLHPDLHGYVRSWERFKGRIPGFRVIASEAPVCDELIMVAGTLDCLADFGGYEHVLDLKTGPAPKSCRFQTAAYDRMLPPYPQGCRRRAAVELHADGSVATLRPHEDFNDANYFLAMVATVRARQQSGVSQIDTQTGEAKWKTR